MRVVPAFEIPHGAVFDGLTIDHNALYALASPDVPQAARDQAVGKAQAGEHITKAEAEAIIAEVEPC